MKSIQVWTCVILAGVSLHVSAFDMSTKIVDKTPSLSPFEEEFPALKSGFTTWYVSNTQGLSMNRVVNRVYVRSDFEDVNASKVFPVFPNKPIPKKDDALLYVEKNVSKEEILKLLQGTSQRPGLNIFGSENRCASDGFVDPDDFAKEGYLPCMYETPSALYLNTFHSELYEVNSPKAQKVTFQIFPITDKKYVFSQSIEGVSKIQGDSLLDAPLTLIDPSLDYYQINVALERASDGKKLGYDLCYDKTKDCKILKMTKKYEKVTYTEKDVEGNSLFSNAILPYYEITLPLTAGINTFRLAYFTYTPHDPYGMYYDFRN